MPSQPQQLNQGKSLGDSLSDFQGKYWGSTSNLWLDETYWSDLLEALKIDKQPLATKSQAVVAVVLGF